MHTQTLPPYTHTHTQLIKQTHANYTHMNVLLELLVCKLHLPSSPSDETINQGPRHRHVCVAKCKAKYLRHPNHKVSGKLDYSPNIYLYLLMLAQWQFHSQSGDVHDWPGPWDIDVEWSVPPPDTHSLPIIIQL